MLNLAGPVIAVGGFGADSHLIGPFTLQHGLEAAGFQVVDLGIQNEFDCLADVSKNCDAALVSNMDGHCRHYLHGLSSVPGTCLWYLGGHPTTSGEEDVRRLGFARFYTGFASNDGVVAALRSDLADVAPRPRPRRDAHTQLPRSPDAAVQGRATVLDHWPTGVAAGDIEDNAPVLADRVQLSELQQADDVLLQPRSGVPQAEDQPRLFGALREAGADVLSFQVDSLTRDGRHADAERVLAENGEINGFPIVNHGAEALRRITEEGGVPVQTRHSARVTATFESARAGERLASTGLMARDQACRVVTKDVLRTSARGLTWPLDAAAPGRGYVSPRMAVLAHFSGEISQDRFLNPGLSLHIAGDMAAGRDMVRQ